MNQTGGIADAIETHDFINSMVDITADDVCIGSSPVYVSGWIPLKVLSCGSVFLTCATP